MGPMAKRMGKSNWSSAERGLLDRKGEHRSEHQEQGRRRVRRNHRPYKLVGLVCMYGFDDFKDDLRVLILFV